MRDYKKNECGLFDFCEKNSWAKNALISVAGDNEHWVCKIESWGWQES